MLTRLSQSIKYLVPAFLAVYVLLWLLAPASVSSTLLTPIMPPGMPSTAITVTLPYKAPSAIPTGQPSLHYKVTGSIYVAPYNTGDTVVVRVDDCPESIRINGIAPPSLQMPPGGVCTLENRQFSFPYAEVGLKQGTNDFEVVFEDLGGYYGADIFTKSTLLKKSLIFVLPALFILLFCAAMGMTRKTWASRSNGIAVLLLALGTYAISISYPEISNTYDEQAHVAAGMQWWEQDQFTYECMTPPLARAAASALLYLHDVTAHGMFYEDMYAVGTRILDTGKGYMNNLTLAREGMLPFYLLGGCCIFLWSRRLYGEKTGLLSLGFYIFSPIITGHAGLAATDLTYGITFVLTVFAFTLWMDRPSILLSCFMGVCAGLMVIAKTSGLVQFPVAAIMILEWHFFYLYAYGTPKTSRLRPYLKWGMFAGLPCFLMLIEATYFFDNFAGFICGIGQANIKNSLKHAVWLFGPLNNNPLWYYFFVGFFFKSPLPFLLLLGAGVWFSTRRQAGLLYQHRTFFPVIASVAVLWCTGISNINIGARHAMPAFIMATIPAGYGLSRLLDARRTYVRYAALGLVLWQLVAFVRIAPDYFAYFNEFAGDHPENVLLDTDLDWGQDLVHLKHTIEEKQAHNVMICNFGNDNYRAVVGPDIRTCDNSHPSGWFAVSYYYILIRPTPEQTRMINEQPYIPVGRSMRLYHLPD